MFFAGKFGVDNFDLWHLYVFISVEQLHKAIVALLCLAIDLDGGRGRAQQRLGAVHRGEHHGGIASVVARGRVLLLVAGVVLLINDDKSQIAVGQENGRPHANHHAGLVAV